ncbi:hypothetical protein MMA231_01829 [Asticcacaulis sp. MM231]
MDYILKRHVVLFSYVPIALVSAFYIYASMLYSSYGLGRRDYNFAITLANFILASLIIPWIGLVFFSFKKKPLYGIAALLGSLILGLIGSFAIAMTGWSQM